MAWSRPVIAPAQLLRQAGAPAEAGPFRVVPEDVDGKRATLGASTLLALADAAERHGLKPDPTWSAATHRLHMALVTHGIPVTLGSVDEGYPLAVTLIGRDGRRVDIEIDEFPDGDPRGRAQRQARTRDRHLTELGWTVVRVPAWRAYLDPEEVADQVLAAAVVNVRR